MNSGTEATSTAVRLARGFTGRDRIVIFHGNFHGATDALLAAGGSGVATLGPARAPPACRPARSPTRWSCRTTSCPSSTSRWRAVIVEPVAANMGVVAPQPGFLEGLRAECDRVGALLDLRRGDHRVPRSAPAAPRRSTTSRPTSRRSAR